MKAIAVTVKVLVISTLIAYSIAAGSKDEDKKYLSSGDFASAEGHNVDDQIAFHSLRLEDLDRKQVAMEKEMWDTREFPFFYDNGYVYEEINVQADFPDLNSKYISSVIKDAEILLPVYELFYILRIKAEFNLEGDSIQGYFINESDKFLIDGSEYRITFKGDTFQIDGADMVLTTEDIYVHQKIIEAIFGIKTEFNFRRMLVGFSFAEEMPYQRIRRLEKRREMMSSGIGSLPEADLNIGQQRHFFRAGAIDWSLTSHQYMNGEIYGGGRLGVGGELFGGTVNSQLFFNSRRDFTHYDQQYEWKYVNNENSFLRQVRVGKGGFGSVSRIPGQVLGASFTNRPTYSKDFFSTYTISDFTNPEWTVELYRNGQLFDYVRTDGSGFYEFEIPVSYGNNTLTLRYYGPHGQVETKEKTINIPHHFAQKGKVEYQASGGAILHHTEPFDPDNPPSFGNFRLDYGISKRLSAGAGLEYISEFDNSLMPFASVSAMPFQDLIISSEYVHDVRSQVDASYRLQNKNVLLGAGWKGLNPEQEAFTGNHLEERYFTAALPIRTSYLNSWMRLRHEQLIYEKSAFHMSSVGISATVRSFTLNMNNFFRWREGFFDNRSVSSNLSLSMPSYKGWNFTPRANINVTTRELLTISGRVSKQIRNVALFTNVSQNINRSNTYVDVGLRYNVGFARTSMSGRSAAGVYSTMQTASGGIFIDDQDMNFQFSDRSMSGRAGIKVIPFLDVNNSGTYDSGDVFINYVDVKIRRGNVVTDARDSIIRITDLLPYEPYFLKFDLNIDADISWRITTPTINVITDANQYKTIYLPVYVAGEISGNVTRQRNGSVTGQERIKMVFENVENGEIINEIMTGYDGFFIHSDLPAGTYDVYPDPEQLENLGYKTENGSKRITLESGRYGDFESNVNFHLVPEEK